MTNPFEPPQSDAGTPSFGPGSFDLQLAFSDGLEATQRNGLVWLGVLLVALVAIGVSFMFCIFPVLIVAPAILWGNTQFTLDAVDGDAEFQTIFSGFDKLGDVVLPILGLTLLLFLISLPGSIVSSIVQYGPAAFTDDTIVIMMASLLGVAVNFAWTIVLMPRFFAAIYLIVEQKRGPVDAISESWELTANVWGQLILFTLATTIATIAGLVLCFVGILPASMIVSGAQASVYRQLTGTRRG